MTPEKTDEQLLADFLAGERSALVELARRYEPPLLGLALGLLGGQRDLACDAVQETWLRVIRFGKQFAGRSRFRTWVYRIAVNQCHTLQALRNAGEPAAVPPSVPPHSKTPQKSKIRTMPYAVPSSYSTPTNG